MTSHYSLCWAGPGLRIIIPLPELWYLCSLNQTGIIISDSTVMIWLPFLIISNPTSISSSDDHRWLMTSHATSGCLIMGTNIPLSLPWYFLSLNIPATKLSTLGRVCFNCFLLFRGICFPHVILYWEYSLCRTDALWLILIRRCIMHLRCIGHQ